MRCFHKAVLWKNITGDPTLFSKLPEPRLVYIQEALARLVYQGLPSQNCSNSYRNLQEQCHQVYVFQLRLLGGLEGLLLYPFMLSTRVCVRRWIPGLLWDGPSSWSTHNPQDPSTPELRMQCTAPPLRPLCLSRPFNKPLQALFTLPC